MSLQCWETFLFETDLVFLVVLITDNPCTRTATISSFALIMHFDMNSSYRERRLFLVPHLVREALEVGGVVVGVAHVLGDPPQVPVVEVNGHQKGFK